MSKLTEPTTRWKTALKAGLLFALFALAAQVGGAVFIEALKAFR